MVLNDTLVPPVTLLETDPYPRVTTFTRPLDSRLRVFSSPPPTLRPERVHHSCRTNFRVFHPVVIQ